MAAPGEKTRIHEATTLRATFRCSRYIPVGLHLSCVTTLSPLHHRRDRNTAPPTQRGRPRKIGVPAIGVRAAGPYGGARLSSTLGCASDATRYCCLNG